MAVIINATTTTGLTTSADNSGVIQFQSNGANTVGISSTGYITVGGNQQIAGPAFSAYINSDQAAPSIGVWTKVTLNSKRFDTNNNFNTSSYRFLPTVAGYYQVNGALNFVSGATSLCACALYLNGSLYKSGEAQSGATAYQILVNDLIYLNGSTDYVELYVYVSSTTALTGSAIYTGMSGAMVRGA